MHAPQLVALVSALVLQVFVAHAWAEPEGKVVARDVVEWGVTPPGEGPPVGYMLVIATDVTEFGVTSPEEGPPVGYMRVVARDVYEFGVTPPEEGPPTDHLKIVAEEVGEFGVTPPEDSVPATETDYTVGYERAAATLAFHLRYVRHAFINSSVEPLDPKTALVFMAGLVFTNEAPVLFPADSREGEPQVVLGVALSVPGDTPVHELCEWPTRGGDVRSIYSAAEACVANNPQLRITRVVLGSASE